MIREFSVTNYKGLQSLALENMGQFVLVSGKNNTGKTTLLESLFLSRNMLNARMLTESFIWRGVNIFLNDTDSIFSPNFYDFSTNNTIKIVINKTLPRDHWEFEFKYSPSNSYKSNTIPTNEAATAVSLVKEESLVNKGVIVIDYKSKNKTGQFSLDFQSNQFSLKEVPPDFADDMKKHKAVFLPSLHRISHQENATRYGKLDQEKNTDFVLKALQMIEPKLRSLSVIPIGNIPLIFGDVGLKRKIPIAYTGDGMNRLLSLLLAMVDAKDGILLIDEIDNGLYWKIMPDVWRVLTEAALINNTQIVATTHNHEMLASVLEASEKIKDELRYIRLEKSKDKVSAKQFDFSSMKTAIEASLEIR